MFELGNNSAHNAQIKVIGIGGGGGNAIEHMMAESIDGVEFVCANTDSQALQRSSAKMVVQLGEEMTKGLGAGANPDIGRQAAEEDRERLREILDGTDMVFITAGMGGGTGTGAAPIVAEIAKELGILTVAVVTKPFAFEGRKRMQIAESGIMELAKTVDSLITIPNNKLLSVLGKNITLLNAFKAANNVLLGAVQGIADLITRPGLINVDFADVRTVMSEMGMAMMGTGEAEGEGRAMQATEMAISNPLIDDYTLKGAKGLLVNITGGKDLKLFEVDEVVNKIRSEVEADAEIIIGAITDSELDGKIRVSIVATSLDGQQPESKSVVNMVHRIQNRNPGYSDFSNIGSSSFNFSNTISSSSITHGANALKLENEVNSETINQPIIKDDINQINNQYHEELLKNQQVENFVENSINNDEVSFTHEAINDENHSLNEHDSKNDLSEFGVDSEAPDLFNNENNLSNSNELLSSDDDDQEDDLEIPAFLRRQKN